MKFFYRGVLFSLLAVSLFLSQVVLAGSVLQVTSEPGVSIWLNTEYIGKTTKEENGLLMKDIAPGEYTIRAGTQGYNPKEIQLTIAENQTVEWRISYSKPVMNIEDDVKRIESTLIESRPVGTIILKSIPLNAKIYFNGESIGNADKIISFAPAVDYSVKFVFQERELATKFSLQADETIFLVADFTKGEIAKESVEVDTGRGPAEIRMQSARKKKPAMFPHRKHQEMYGCESCHHGMDEEGKQAPYAEGMEIQHCVTCHNPVMENKKLSSLTQAAHTLCKGCHKQVVEESGAAGPIGKCSGCHTVLEDK